jgi:type IV secretion system protein VirD4
MHVATAENGRRRDLSGVNEALELAEEGLQLEMQESPLALVRTLARGYYEKEDRERKGVLSTVRTHLSFLGSVPMQGVLGDGDFSLDAFKTRKMTVYLCMPAIWFEANKRWFRLFVNLALHALGEQLDTRTQLPVLMVLDEFPTLGTMQQVDTAIGLMAGFGVKIWTIVQDINQLRTLYKDRWQSFIGNSGLVQFFGNVDRETCEYVSKLCGDVTYRTESTTATIGTGARGEDRGSTSTQESLQVIPLLRPDEVAYWFAARRSVQILKIPEYLPMKLYRIPFHQHPILRQRAA